MKREDERGFTLAELLVVVLILGIIGALVIPKFAAQPEKARQAVAQADLKTIRTALDVYKIENPAAGFPAPGEIGAVLEQAGIRWTGAADGIRDPWGGPYKYMVHQDQYVVTTTGQKDGLNWYVTEKGDPQEGNHGTAGWSAGVSCTESE